MSATQQTVGSAIEDGTIYRKIGVPLLLALPVVAFVIYISHQTAKEGRQVFDTHFAPLPEVQEMYNTSALKASWKNIDVSGFTHWSRIGSDSPPETLLELTTNLLLKSVTKQHALEKGVETLKSDIGSLIQFVHVLALGFAFMFIVNAMLMGVLWKRTSGISK